MGQQIWIRGICNRAAHVKRFVWIGRSSPKKGRASIVGKKAKAMVTALVVWVTLLQSLDYFLPLLRLQNGLAVTI